MVSAWSAVGAGPNSPVMGAVTTIAVSGTDVYVGGHWTHYQMPGDCIARWDGASWSTLGEGVDDTVYAITASGTGLYVGGWFSQAGDVSGTKHIARWDGSGWSALGSGTSDIVYTIAVRDATGDVYVGGAFA